MPDLTTSIILRNGGGEITIDTPDFGYTALINLAMTRSNLLGGGRFNWFDHGNGQTLYDWRLSNLQLNLDPDHQKSFQDFLRNGDQGRGNEFQMVCPDGISPYGPDVGINRAGYQSRVIEGSFSGVNRRPWMHFNNDFTFLLTGSNRTQKPSEISPRGDYLQIGDVDGLRYPLIFPEPATDYPVSTVSTYGGNGHSIDLTSGDGYSSVLRVTEDAKVTGWLINYLVTRARGFEFFITAGENGFIFGRDNTEENDRIGSGRYRVVLFDNVIQCTHVAVDTFRTEFSVSLREFIKT